MQRLRSLAYALVFYPVSVFIALAGLIVILFGQGPTRVFARRWADFHHWLTEHILSLHLSVEGSIPEGAVLIAVKHESMYETVEIVRVARAPVVVLKRELLRIPLFGAFARRYGVIPVDRNAGASALREMMARGRDAAAHGRAVIIFPEGTRVPAGEKPALRPGFAGLYRALGLPVVPVAVDSGRLWGRGMLKRSGVIRFRVGETIPAGLKRHEIEARVHAAINALN